MASPTFLNPPPHQASPGRSVTFKVLESEFGDGYEQAAADGINNIRESWDLVWQNEDQVDVDFLTTFFDDLAGHKTFFWIPPGEVTPKLWRVNEGYGVDPDAGFSSTFSATFKRWFGEDQF